MTLKMMLLMLLEACEAVLQRYRVLQISFIGIFATLALLSHPGRLKATEVDRFSTALSASIYDLRWAKVEWNVDHGISFHEHAPNWLRDFRYQFPQARIDYEFAERLAEMAYETAKIRNTRGLCLAGVADALKEMLPGIANFYKLPIDQNLADLKSEVLFGIGDLPTTMVDLPASPRKKNTYNGGGSAVAFWQWTQENPRQLCELFGFMEVENLPVESLEDGFVAIYAPGECGFHSRFGHIEIVVGNKGCSDHCRQLRQDCQPSAILAPVDSCAKLALNLNQEA